MLSTFEQVRSVIVQLLNKEPGEVVPGARLREDLIADSLDMDELNMALGEEFRDVLLQFTKKPARELRERMEKLSKAIIEEHDASRRSRMEHDLKKLGAQYVELVGVIGPLIPEDEFRQITTVGQVVEYIVRLRAKASRHIVETDYIAPRPDDPIRQIQQDNQPAHTNQTEADSVSIRRLGSENEPAGYNVSVNYRPPLSMRQFVQTGATTWVIATGILIGIAGFVVGGSLQGEVIKSNLCLGGVAALLTGTVCGVLWSAAFVMSVAPIVITSILGGIMGFVDWIVVSIINGTTGSNEVAKKASVITCGIIGCAPFVSVSLLVPGELFTNSLFVTLVVAITLAAMVANGAVPIVVESDTD